MEFWRGEAYTAYVDYLESTGGFYYEVNLQRSRHSTKKILTDTSHISLYQRWGDAPVHTLAVSLFLPKDKIHFFDQIGYTHEPHSHCPQDLEFSNGRCSCEAGLSIGAPINCLFHALMKLLNRWFHC